MILPKWTYFNEITDSNGFSKESLLPFGVLASKIVDFYKIYRFQWNHQISVFLTKAFNEADFCLTKKLHFLENQYHSNKGLKKLHICTALWKSISDLESMHLWVFTQIFTQLLEANFVWSSKRKNFPVETISTKINTKHLWNLTQCNYPSSSEFAHCNYPYRKCYCSLSEFAQWQTKSLVKSYTQSTDNLPQKVQKLIKSFLINS